MGSHPVMVRSLPELGSLWVEAWRDLLRVRFIAADGAILDDFAIRKQPEHQAPGAFPLIASALVLIGATAAALWAGRRRSAV